MKNDRKYTEALISKYNEQIGYNIEDIIKELGYEVLGYSLTGAFYDANYDANKIYTNSQGDIAQLFIFNNGIPNFMVDLPRNPNTECIYIKFTDPIYVAYKIPLEKKVKRHQFDYDYWSGKEGEIDLGVNRYNDDPHKMSYYSYDTRIKLWEYDSSEPEKMPEPDLTNYTDATDPFERINAVREWAKEIQKKYGYYEEGKTKK